MAEAKTEGRSRRMRRFLGEVGEERQKVAWPTKDKAKQSVVLVIAVSAMLAVYIGVLDVALSWVFRLLLRS